MVTYSFIGIADPSILATSGMIGEITVDKVNYYLNRVWLDASSYLDNWEEESGDVWRYSDKFVLAEHRTRWLESSSEWLDFHVVFGPPQVQPLCPVETILFLDIQQITFYPDGLKK